MTTAEIDTAEAEEWAVWADALLTAFPDENTQAFIDLCEKNLGPLCDPDDFGLWVPDLLTFHANAGADTWEVEVFGLTFVLREGHTGIPVWTS